MNPHDSLRPAATTRRFRPLDWLVVLAPLAALALAGCGTASASRPADPDRARAALRATLDAWKRGDRHDAPAVAGDPVRVADEDWLAGARLLDYRLDVRDAGRAVGAHLRCPVELTLAGPKGKPQKKSAVYDVGTDPVVTVIRQDRP